MGEEVMKTIAGGLIALVLLFFYILLVFKAAAIAECIGTQCGTFKSGDFNDVMAQAMTVLGGLVSALIISELAATEPGQAPRMLGSDSQKAKVFLRWTTGLYIAAWLFTGAWAFWKGMNYPSALPALTSVGQSWLGLSVASAYAYFGIKSKR
jgi:hypothetical protein